MHDRPVRLSLLGLLLALPLLIEIAARPHEEVQTAAPGRSALMAPGLPISWQALGAEAVVISGIAAAERQRRRFLAGRGPVPTGATAQVPAVAPVGIVSRV